MAERFLRTKQRFDYKVYDRTGVQIPLSSTKLPTTEGTMSADANMSKVSGTLAGLLFQLDELLEDVADPSKFGIQEIRDYHDELKSLRIQIVTVSSELSSLTGEDYPKKTDSQVKKALSVSKDCIKLLKETASATEQRKQSADTEEKNVIKEKKSQEMDGRKFAFNSMLSEIGTITASLIDKYNIHDDEEEIDSNMILKRKENKSNYAADVQRVKLLVDRLLNYTDIVFEGKDEVLQNHYKKLNALEKMKVEFEEKLRLDLEEYDLSDRKLKLAAVTKVNIGKFNGSLEKGMDFYTFKSKFLKAYASYPKALLVEWLTNNHLEGKAKDCIGSLDCVNEIWKRLENNFGNTEEMLQHQFKKINQLGPMRLQKSYESKKHYLQCLVNVMQDVLDLATEHDLLGEIHFGCQLQKVASMLESDIETKWYTIVAEEELKKQDRWKPMLRFLNKQLKIVQVRAAETGVQTVDDEKNKDQEPPRRDNTEKPGGTFHATEQCKLCDEQHPNSNTEFVLCKRFLQMRLKERGPLVRSKKYCVQCLDGKTKWNDVDHKCSNDWVCKHPFHEKYKKKLHFLLCEPHSNDETNKQLYDDFKKNVLKAEWQKRLHSSIYCMHESSSSMENCERPDCDDARSYGTPAYILQPYPFDGHVFNLMFDTGCQNFVCRNAAVEGLPNTHKENTMKGPIIISGVGCQQVTSNYGQYSVKLPAYDKTLVKFTGICLDVITGVMPPYPVKEACKSIIDDYVAGGGKKSDLPNVPMLVGGETDFLIGMQYNYYQPRLVHILTTGLAIYQSMFLGVDNTRGCIGGPHKVFEMCERQFLEKSNVTQFKAFLQQQLQLFNNRNPGMS